MKTMQTIRVVPKGRIFPIVGKHQTTLCGMFSSKRLRDLFGVIKLEYTHYSDVDLIAANMARIVNGNYKDISLSQCLTACETIPSSLYRH